MNPIDLLKAEHVGIRELKANALGLDDGIDRERLGHRCVGMPDPVFIKL